MTNVNPRFLAYAHDHGMTPSEMLTHDDQRFPGGKMTGFILWMADRWRTWKRDHGGNVYKCGDGTTEAGHAVFDRWLTGATA